MAKRPRERVAEASTSYFTGEKPGLKFVSTGCTVLDCALGGGWVLGRIANIVGDKSTAKTALGCEALINFLLTYPEGDAAYREAEAAFDRDYAAAMGLPVDKIDFGNPKNPPIATVEEFARDFERFLDLRIKTRTPGIYVLDSLDALSDEAEMDRNLGDATYGTAKAKLLSEFFRTTARKIESSQVALIVVSQVRDNIGAMFGEKHKRSGGRSLDFYASQVLWLSKLKTLKRTIDKVERPYGVVIKAQVKKNKVSLPFREAEFEFHFGYGVEDAKASIDWLKEVGRLDPSDAKDLLAGHVDMDNKTYAIERDRLAACVKLAWAEIETTFLPKRTKYG